MAGKNWKIIGVTAAAEWIIGAHEAHEAVKSALEKIGHFGDFRIMRESGNNEVHIVFSIATRADGLQHSSSRMREIVIRKDDPNAHDIYTAIIVNAITHGGLQNLKPPAQFVAQRAVVSMDSNDGLLTREQDDQHL